MKADLVEVRGSPAPVGGLPWRLSRALRYLQRGSVRGLTLPAARLPEGAVKNQVRRCVLSLQNSLPVQLAVNRGDTVIQIGTPYPATMKRFHRAVGNRGRLVIFEALPENHARLVRAVEAERLSNVILVEGAAFSETRPGELQVSPLKDDSKIDVPGVLIDNDLMPENQAMMPLKVQFMRLDDALPERGVDRFDFLSVTVNGAELEVLYGARALLAASRPGARVYAKGHSLDSAGVPIHREMKRLLEELGYRVVISRGERSPAAEAGWGRRAGDVFGWKL